MAARGYRFSDIEQMIPFERDHFLQLIMEDHLSEQQSHADNNKYQHGSFQ